MGWPDPEVPGFPGAGELGRPDPSWEKERRSQAWKMGRQRWECPRKALVL